MTAKIDIETGWGNAGCGDGLDIVSDTQGKILGIERPKVANKKVDPKKLLIVTDPVADMGPMPAGHGINDW